MNREEAFNTFKALVAESVPSGSGQVRLNEAMYQAYEINRNDFPAKHLLSILSQVVEIDKLSAQHQKTVKDLYFYWA